MWHLPLISALARARIRKVSKSIKMDEFITKAAALAVVTTDFSIVFYTRKLSSYLQDGRFLYDDVVRRCSQNTDLHLCLSYILTLFFFTFFFTMASADFEKTK